jgi:hypothetical protein
MKPLYLLLLTTAGLFACNGRPGIDYTPLTLSAMYDPDSVRMALDGGDSVAAEKKLTAAIDQLKKQKDTVGSIPLFKAAILLKPTAKGYFELSGALLSTYNKEEAIEALHMAERLGYSPVANVMIRYCYAYSLLAGSYPNDKFGDTAIRYMQLALQMGYARPQDFLQRQYFPTLARSDRFASAFSDALSGMAGRDPQKSLWDSYAGQFPEVPLPLAINLQWIKSHPLEDAISFEFQHFIPEMRSEKFDRGGGTMYYYVALIRKSAAFTAVVYGEQYEDDEEETEANATADADSTKPAANDQTTVTSLFSLVTYDHQGKIIDRLRVAGRDGQQTSLKAFAIQPNLHFQVQYIPDVPDSARLVESPDYYLIDASGKFVKADAPLAAR